MKITIDRGKCAGLGICESLAPKYLEVDDGGDLVVLQEIVDAAELSEVEEAVAACPTGALLLTES